MQESDGQNGENINNNSNISNVEVLLREVENLKALLNESKKENEALNLQVEERKNDFLRSVADLQNAKKIFESEKQGYINFANQKILKDIITPLETLFIALKNKPSESESQIMKDLYKGIEITSEEFTKALLNHGLERICPELVKFNPEFHQAVSMLNSNEHDDDIVIETVQAGYVLNGRVVKPALVVVCKKAQ